MSMVEQGSPVAPVGARPAGRPGDALAARYQRDVGFAFGIVLILVLLFLPIPAWLIDIGLSVSIAFSVLILMVALWIREPLEFSAFPTVLLIATMLRLSLNIASTRLILSQGSEGVTAAGHVIGGFSTLVMRGDFVIGLIVFAILVTVNFLVITKGATRIAEVGARFTLDAIPGKQMAIDADLSAGLIDEKEAQRRRRILEEESSFFGAMDGASKFVRGDAIAGLIITAINIFGGIVIGTTRHGLSLAEAADVFTRLSVGDGLVSQIPALIVSLAAGLLVSKGANRGSAEKVLFAQLGGYPRALMVAAVLMLILALVPGLPFLPFFLLGLLLGGAGWLIMRRAQAESEAEALAEASAREEAAQEEETSVQAVLEAPALELRLGKQLAVHFMKQHDELEHRVARMRRRFAEQYGFVVPEIRLSDDLDIDPKTYQIRLHGTVVASHQLRIGEVLVITGEGRRPSLPCEETREPAFGMPACWLSEHLKEQARLEGFEVVDIMSVMLTHLSETISNNLAQLLSYRDVRMLLDRLPAEYQRLIDEIVPAQITFSGIQAVLKLLLAERVSIRSLELILESIAEIAPHVRRAEQIVEHVRLRLARQICGDIAEDGVLRVLRLGNRWDLAFHESIRRKGDEVVEFDIDPRLVEEFSEQAARVIRQHMDAGYDFALVTAHDARPFVRMITERLFPTLPVLSQLEIARGVQVEVIGSIS
jgi:flagellar biosynthesis protein FlhA